MPLEDGANELPPFELRQTALDVAPRKTAEDDCVRIETSFTVKPDVPPMPKVQVAPPSRER